MIGRHWRRALALAALMLSLGAAGAAETASAVDPRDRDDCAQEADHERSIAGCTRLIAANPRDAVAFYNRGNAYRLNRDFARALADYDDALRISPKYAAAFDNRGIVHHLQGEFDRAVLNFDAALQIDPKMSNAYMNRGNAFDAKHEYDRAIADYDMALKLRPSGLGHYNRAVAERHKGDEAAALADYDEAIRLDPKYPPSYLSRALILERLGRLDEALRDLRAFVPMSPDSAPGAAALARIERKVGGGAKSAPSLAAKPTESRVALVIGNSAYLSVPALPNPKHDAASVAEALRAAGFDVVLAIDATRPQMVAAMQDFEHKAANADWALVYYAGHGIEAGGRNFLIPVDARLESDTHAEDETVALDRVEAAVANGRRLRLVVLDACRNNPFLSRMKRAGNSQRAVERGLTPVEPTPGTMIVYATRGGAVASDGAGGHSPFTAAFLKEMQRPGLEVRRLFDYVRDDVIEATQGVQQPFSYGSLPAREDYYFKAAAK